MQPERDAQRPSKRSLSTWKEIAEYLGVNVRTAQKWEQWRGLPVRRLPGGRGRVLADVRELDAWMKSATPADRPDTHGGRGLLWAGSVAVLVLLLIGGALALFQRSGTPARLKVDGNALVVSDERGEELWRQTFGVDLGDYQTQFHRAKREYGAIVDLDGDGEQEVLFIVCPKPSQVRTGGFLACYSASGREQWRYEPGRGAEEFPEILKPPYLPLNLLVFRSAGRTRIAVSSIHHSWFPSEVAVLSGDGKLLNAYWHAGHLHSLATIEGPDPARPFLAAGGVANGYRSAALVVLNPEDFGGTSREESPEHQLPGPPGREWARVLFPRSELNGTRNPFNVVSGLRVAGSKLEVMVNEDPDGSAEVAHTFDSPFRYLGAELTSNFAARHEELRRLGLLRAPLEESQIERELGGIRWLKAPPEVDLQAMAERDRLR